MRVIHVETTTHGRVLLEDAADSLSSRLLVAFHGYGESASDLHVQVQQIPGIARWRIAAVQGLHRFYTRDDRTVVASWMTREDRELAIADNVAYVDRVVDLLKAQGERPKAQESQAQRPQAPDPQLVFLGFSQGVAMAYRAALLGRHRAAGIVAIGGDIPPELKDTTSGVESWPQVLVAAGTRDPWYTSAKVDEDAAFLATHRIPHEVVRYDGGHEWTSGLREEIGRRLKYWEKR